MAPEINKDMLQAELQELAGNLKVKVTINKSQRAATHITETDKRITFSLNPKRFRSPKKLEQHLNMYRDTAIGIASDIKR